MAIATGTSYDDLLGASAGSTDSMSPDPSAGADYSKALAPTDFGSYGGSYGGLGFDSYGSPDLQSAQTPTYDKSTTDPNFVQSGGRSTAPPQSDRWRDENQGIIRPPSAYGPDGMYIQQSSPQDLFDPNQLLYPNPFPIAPEDAPTNQFYRYQNADGSTVTMQIPWEMLHMFDPGTLTNLPADMYDPLYPRTGQDNGVYGNTSDYGTLDPSLYPAPTNF